MKQLCWFLCFFTSSAFGQFNVGMYLSRTVDDVEIEAIQAQQDFVQDANFRPTIFREFEIRFRARDFETGFDDYRLRVGFTNPWERRANKQYGTALMEQLESQRQVDYSAVLAGRYHVLIGHRKVLEKMLLNRKAIDVYQQLFRAHSGRGEDAKELIELDRKLFILGLGKQDMVANLQSLEQQIKTYYPFEGTISEEAFEWISVSTLATFIQQYQIIDIEQNIHVRNEQNKVTLAEKDLQINKQEEFSNIGYVQAEYRPYNGESIDETLGMQIGVQIPIVNPDRGDLQRRELGMLKDKQDAAIVRAQIVSEQNQLYNHMIYLIGKHDLVHNKLMRLSGTSLASSGNLSAVVTYTDYIQDLQELENEIYINLLTTYVDWLKVSGILSSEAVNYLSEGFEVFGES